MSLNLKPLGDRLVVEPKEREQTTASGLVLPESAKEKPQEAEVLAVGPGKLLDDGGRATINGRSYDFAVSDGISGGAAAAPVASGEGTPVCAELAGQVLLAR